MTAKAKSMDKELLLLKTALQGLNPNDFEKLAVDLLTEFVGVLFRQAQSGSQQGADATASGPRELRMEARRYRDNTTLDRRGLAFGEPHLTGVTLSGDSVHLFVVDTIEGLVLWASGERGVSLVLISNGASSLRHIRQEHLCQL